MNHQPVALIIRDGWGENHNPVHDPFNAIKCARTPTNDAIRKKWPRTEIRACGLAVGLPEGMIGNSEVGHQNIGAGRVVDQEVVRIDKAIASGILKENETLNAAFTRACEKGRRLHLLGIVSDAGVHGLLEHLYSLLKLAKDRGIPEVYLHAFTDGRDTPPHSGLGYIRQIEAQMQIIGVGKIATVCGRFWSMDRDQRWDRIQKAYHCLIGYKTEATAPSAERALQQYYDNPIDASRQGDEFVLPTWIVDDHSRPVAIIEDGDIVIFYNYRGDRPREITCSFIEDGFDAFERGPKRDLFYATMTEYQNGLCPNVIFCKPPKIKNILGSYLSDLGIPQFRCAETEKYPHVTFFFNDYREKPFAGEERKLIPSPQVSTYDKRPEMSAPEVWSATKQAILSQKYGLVVVNFANPDMVGHTGSLKATIKACETVDKGVGKLLEAIAHVGGRAFVTADHGNAEQMFDPSVGGPHTAHTLNPVEVVIVGHGCENLKLREDGRLADIAPTLLKLMNLSPPKEMTGENLIL